jgi:uncharacterized protein YegL
MLEGALTVFPLYFVCEESASMAGTSIEVVNDGIVELFDEISADPVLDERIRVGIIAFNDSVRVLLRLTQLSDVIAIPLVVASGSTSYANVFKFLRNELEKDLDVLKQQFNVRRPLVFFISHGTPNSNDNWRDELSKLTDPMFKFSPNIVSFGVEGADKSVIAEVAHWGSKTEPKFYFMAQDISSPAPALLEIINWACNMRATVEPGYSITDGETVGNDSVRVYVVEAKK